ncbi:Putative type III effector (HLK1)(fragment) [Ralstonia solanacearum K60]
MLKRDMHPRSNHLIRLLEAGQIRCVEAPGRLPPEEGNDKVGTLFEIGIQFKPLSNRRRAAPWFVPVHTDKPVTAQALPTMAFTEFTAVHLKTAKEKKRGGALGGGDARAGLHRCQGAPGRHRPGTAEHPVWAGTKNSRRPATRRHRAGPLIRCGKRRQRLQRRLRVMPGPDGEAVKAAAGRVVHGIDHDLTALRRSV